MSETNTTDNNTYHEVNIDSYPQLQDNDNAGPFDRQAKLFTNANGEITNIEWDLTKAKALGYGIASVPKSTNNKMM